MSCCRTLNDCFCQPMKSKTALAIAILFIWLCCDTLYQVIKYHNRDNKHQLHRGVLSLVSELLFMPEDSNRESKTLLPFRQQNKGNFVEELSINNTHLSLAKNTTLLLAQNNLSELAPLVDYHMKKHMKQGERKQHAATRVKICICALTRSKITWNTLEDSRIIKNVVASTYRTTSMQWDKFEVQILVGADSDDAFWLQHADSLEVEARNNYAMHLKFKFYQKMDNFLPFNDLMRDGYYTGSDYLLRINDDTEFTSSAWISLGVDTLKNFHPPNVGVVGPSCQQGNTKIMTHDMVHRTHLDIFKTYYPVVFHNWYIDNWISLVYGPNRTKKIKNWTVVHHVEQQGQRYKQVTSDSQWLQREVDSGSNTIRIYLKYLKNTSSHTKTTTSRNVFDFSAIVLTKNRPVDLLRLLKSIENTNFNGDKINLVIKVDKSIDNHRVIDVANNFSFTHGTKTVHISPFKKGLKNAWLNAWIPETKHERAIILEDDIELSPAWYTWLKDAWAKYKDHDSVMGISLCRETRIMKVPPGANYKREIVNNNNPYLYKFVGTWGYSPNPEKWTRFLQWVKQNDDKSFNFFNVPGILPTKWWKEFIKTGRTDSMWTQLMHYYVDRVQPNLYHMYVNLPGKETIAAHYRSKGEHYNGEGVDFKLAVSLKHDFPTILNKYGWDGKLVSQLQQDNAVTTNAQV